MSLDAAALWAVFLEDGAREAARMRVLAAEITRPPLSRDGLAELATAAFSVAASALMVGVEEIARIATTLETAAEVLAEGTPVDPHLGSALAGAAVALDEAFATLARPDASGARVASAPLDSATNRLAELLPASPERSRPLVSLAGLHPPGPGPSASAAAAPASAAAFAPASSDAASHGSGGAAPDEDTTWVPQVDDDMIDPFIEEANERIEGLSQKLLRLEAAPDDAELVREIFRDLHTVKGSSGFVGLRKMNRLSHAAEDLVGLLRDGQRKVDRGVIDALLGTLDGLRDILGRAIARAPIDTDLRAILRRLKDPAAPPSALDEALDADAHAAATATADGAADGADADTANPARARAAHAGSGSTGASAVAARAVTQKQTLRVDFEKLDLLMNLVGELVLGKTGLHAAIQGLTSLGRELESERRLARKLGALAGQLGGPVTSAVTGTREHPARQVIRSLGEELGRVERVFAEVAQDLSGSGRQIDYVTGELRVQVMKLRMLPIARIFTKYRRTVRELGQTLGKQVRLELHGEDTELDKILVEQLDDPLMHLVRNAVDHGIEPPEARERAGKPREGVLGLHAYHRGNQMVIEIRDDGGGISPDKLRAKAIEKGLITAEQAAALDDRAALDIIFRPGFSTAARISEVSGRGVGMDVVREAISRLKGSIEVTSRPGQGSTFTLRLPLTLAIIQVLMARVAGESFALPLDIVVRTVMVRPTDVQRVLGQRVIAVEGRQVALLDLAGALELDVAAAQVGDLIPVVLVEVGGETYGLECERLEDRREIVIKPLGDLLQNVECAAGATLLGERCAIILDVPAVVARAIRHGRRATAPPPPAHTPATAPGGSGASAAGKRHRILLAEDSDTIREALRRLLEADGFAVTEAPDGAEALALAERERFDLVSTDVMMPNLDGYELTRRLRALPAYRDVPIVMVTSRAEKIDRVRGFDAGVDDYITKPHDREELLRAVHKHLRGGR